MTGTKFALLSLTNKTGVEEFAKGLVNLGFRLLSTGGTAQLLRDAGLSVTDVAEFTGHPECLDGRVKTLHPKVHGGVLADRSKSSHLEDMKRLGFQAVDLVAVNLYDFAGQAKGQGKPLSQVIEHIDVGGPTMLRAAAKNHKHVYVVVDPADYPRVLLELAKPNATEEFRAELAAKVFQTTAHYDQMIANEFKANLIKSSDNLNPNSASTALNVNSLLPEKLELSLDRLQTLRYGENSHQHGGLYSISSKSGFGLSKILQGKEVSYNNYMDLDAAAAIVADLDPIAGMTIIKHTNPCGTAILDHLPVSSPALALFEKALSSDPKCAFGGIVASNIEIDETCAGAMAEIFLECVIAPKFTDAALKVFAAKKNLRIVQSEATLKKGRKDQISMRSIVGGILVQSLDDGPMDSKSWKCVSNAQPNQDLIAELGLAMTLARHVKSNAIVVTRDRKSIGIGAGQMSRVDAARIAVEKAKELGHSPCGAVAASDAFFPFRDSIDILAKAGIKAIVQPGGSLRDKECIDAANEHGIVMMLSGLRHFKH